MLKCKQKARDVHVKKTCCIYIYANFIIFHQDGKDLEITRTSSRVRSCGISLHIFTQSLGADCKKQHIQDPVKKLEGTIQTP